MTGQQPGTTTFLNPMLASSIMRNKKQKKSSFQDLLSNPDNIRIISNIKQLEALIEQGQALIRQKENNGQTDIQSETSVLKRLKQKKEEIENKRDNFVRRRNYLPFENQGDVQLAMNEEIKKVLHEQTQQGEGHFNMVDDTGLNKKIVFIKTPNKLYLDNRVLTQKSTTQQLSIQQSSLATEVTFAIELLDYANGRLCPFTEYMRSEEAKKFYGQDLNINKMYVLIRKFQKSYSYGIKPYLKKNEERIYLAVCDDEASQISSISQEPDDDDREFFENVLGKINKVVKDNQNTNYVVFKKKSRVGSTETVIPCTNDNLELIANKSTNYLPTGQDGNMITSTGMLNVFDFHKGILILKYPTNENFYYIMTHSSNIVDDANKIQYQAKDGENLTYVYKNRFYKLASPVFFNKTDSSYKFSFNIIDEIKKNNLRGLLESDRKDFADAFFKTVRDEKSDYGNTYIGSLRKFNDQRNKKNRLAELKNVLIKRFMQDPNYQGKQASDIEAGINTLFAGYQDFFKEGQIQKLVKQRIKKNFKEKKVDDIKTKLMSTNDELEIQALNQLLNDKYYNYKNPYTYIESGRRRNIIDKLIQDLQVTKETTQKDLRQKLERKGKNILTPEQIQSILINKKRGVPALLKNYDDNKKVIEKLQEEIKKLEGQADKVDQVKTKSDQIARLRNKENQLIKAINTKYKLQAIKNQELEAKDLQNLYGVRNLGSYIPYPSSGRQREQILEKLKDKFNPTFEPTEKTPKDIKQSINTYFQKTMTPSQRRRMLKEKLKDKDKNKTLKDLITALGEVDSKTKELIDSAKNPEKKGNLKEIKQNLSLNQVEKEALLQSIKAKTLEGDHKLTQDDLNTYRQIKEGPIYTNILGKKDEGIQNALVNLKKEKLLTGDVNQNITKSLRNTRKKQYQEKALLKAVKQKMDAKQDIFGDQTDESKKDLQRELLRIAKKYPELQKLDADYLKDLQKKHPSYAKYLAETIGESLSSVPARASGIVSSVPGTIANLLESISNNPQYRAFFKKNDKSNKQRTSASKSQGPSSYSNVPTSSLLQGGLGTLSGGPLQIVDVSGGLHSSYNPKHSQTINVSDITKTGKD